MRIWVAGPSEAWVGRTSDAIGKAVADHEFTRAQA
jgi:hypothetical protein